MMTTLTKFGAAATVAVALASAPALAQDAESGQDVFKQCRACHQIGAGAKNLVGPQLNAIIGRKVSAIEDFNYSQASKDTAAKGTVWTEETLDKYLENPIAFMPGTKMAYAGVKDAGDRKDLIAYLKKAGAK